jgi:hypothetical protein
MKLIVGAMRLVHGCHPTAGHERVHLIAAEAKADMTIDCARRRFQMSFGGEQSAHRFDEAIITFTERTDPRVSIRPRRVVGDLMKNAFDELPALGIHQAVEHTICR